MELGHCLCSSEAITQDPAQPAAKTPEVQDIVTFCCAPLLEGEKCHTASTPAAAAAWRERAPGAGEH